MFHLLSTPTTVLARTAGHAVRCGQAVRRRPAGLLPLGAVVCAALLAAGCQAPSNEQAEWAPAVTGEARGTTVSSPASSVPLPAAPVEPLSVPPAPAVATAPSGYAPREKLEGRMRSIGSDTMDQLMLGWQQEFTQHHPGLDTFHEGKGSGTAVPALCAEQADFGPMSRSCKSEEVNAFNASFGYPPAQVRVAMDNVAIYVHPSNPVARTGLTMAQLDAIFSKTRKRGHAQDISRWGQLGLTGEWEDALISLYGRNSASGTFGFFKEEVMLKGDYKKTIKECVGSLALATTIADDRFAIGYSGIGYKTDQVAMVPLSAVAGKPARPPEPQYAYSGEYPLARFLYVAINAGQAGSTLPPLQREFMAYVLSGDGQNVVHKEGFFPLSAKVIAEERRRLGL